MRAVRLTASVFALTLGMTGGAIAQTPYPSVPSPYAVQPLSDADQLASEIRLLATNPQDLQALVRAGELALKLDDDTAAAAFFARAERIDPRNARVKAGEGSLLVSAERPGDALRHFAEAERLGGDPRSFAADRGLAYDLVGEQERAQREYRLALGAGPNDETQRRYALSLGISGKRDLALAQIDPLLRKSDRGAWRSRAFILAMGGDKAGAEKIATSMMPAGMAQGLQPFFDILPSLRPADRAFAVHFGEVRATPERVLDARMVPPLAALGPDPTAPVAVAAVTPKAAAAVDAREERRKAREARKAHGRVEVAAVTPPAPQPLPAPPIYVAQAPAPAYVPPATYRRPSSDARAVMAANTAHLPPVATAAPRTAAPVTFVQRLPSTATPPVQAPVVVASVPQRVLPTPVPTRAPLVAATPSLETMTAAAPSVGATVQRSAPATPVRAPSELAIATPARSQLLASPAPPEAARATVVAATSPVAPAPRTVEASTARPATLSAAAEAAPVVAAAAPPAAIVAPPPAPVAAAPTVTPTPVRSEDSILAAIISDITVPGAELQPTPTIAPVRVEAPAADTAAADRAAAEKATAAKTLADEKLAEKEAADKKAADKKLADKKAAADKKALADKKAAADKKIADAKKLADAKAAEEKRKHDPKLLEPSRAWVQVAGGANENDLPKQWAKLRSANAKVFAGRSGWTTPLRATNRILTGPFDDSDDAQAFVNKLTKEGLSGFVFVSEAGQKITKLGGK